MGGKQRGRQIGHALYRRIAQGDRIKAAFDVEGQVGGGFAGRALVVPDKVAGRIHEGETEGTGAFEGFACNEHAPLVRKRGPVDREKVPEQKGEEKEEDGFGFHLVVFFVKSLRAQVLVLIAKGKFEHLEGPVGKGGHLP